MRPYVCPYMQNACGVLPCAGLTGEDIDDPDTGCSFTNPKVLSACLYANEQEWFEKPCYEGFDTYLYGEEYYYSD